MMTSATEAMFEAPLQVLASPTSYYSSYGHIETMTYAVAEGVREAGAEAVVKRVPELAPLEVAKRAGYKLDQAAPIATVNELEHLGRNPNCLQGASTTPASRRKKQGRSD